jgi:hypothetical protein
VETAESRRREDNIMRGAFNIVMRIFSTLLGLLVVLMGLVWIGQGLRIGPAAIMRGFMVNDMRWALYGAILALFGIGQVVWSNVRAR